MPNVLEGINMIVVGGGFAGLSAGYKLAELGAKVTVLEARSDIGGRVRSNPNFIPGLTIEYGAELIGSNHPVWLAYARRFGLPMSLISESGNFSAAGLQPQMYLNGEPISPMRQEELEKEAQAKVHAPIWEDAKAIDAYYPWLSPRAGEWDNTTVDQKLRELCGADSDLLDLIRLEMENDQTVATMGQSYLGFLAAVKGAAGKDARPEGYWEDTEVFRCGRGNQQLARSLEAAILLHTGCEVLRNQFVNKIVVLDNKAQVYTKGSPNPREARYVILAVPPTVWADITLEGIGIPSPLPKVTTGSAVKFFSKVRSRFWIEDGKAPTSLSNIVGMTWEGSDNQISYQPEDPPSAELSVFAGGSAAERIKEDHNQEELKKQLQTIYPGYDKDLVKSELQDWTTEPHIMTGYSCPGPGQVCTSLKELNSVFAGSLLFAGEHVSPCFFGFMEGALQSGITAAGKVATLAGVGKFNLHGADDGATFDGLSDITQGITGIARLSKLEIMGVDLIDGLSPTYEILNPDNKTTSEIKPQYGSQKGTRKAFEIPPGDALTSVSGFSRIWKVGKDTPTPVIAQLTLKTERGSSQTFGKKENDDKPFSFTVPAGQEIIGFYGKPVPIHWRDGTSQLQVIGGLGVIYRKWRDLFASEDLMQA